MSEDPRITSGDNFKYSTKEWLVLCNHTCYSFYSRHMPWVLTAFFIVLSVAAMVAGWLEWTRRP